MRVPVTKEAQPLLLVRVSGYFQNQIGLRDLPVGCLPCKKKGRRKHRI